MNNEEKILAMLAEMKEDLAAVKATQAAQGERLCNIEMRIENTIIPDIKTLAGGHMQLLETLASKESIEELKDSMVEWEAVNKASLSEMWKRIAAIECTN